MHAEHDDAYECLTHVSAHTLALGFENRIDSPYRTERYVVLRKRLESMAPRPTLGVGQSG